MAIRKSLLGQEITTYTKNDESYDIVVRFNKKSRDKIETLLDQRLIFRNNKGKLLNIPIRSVIENPKEVSSYTAVIRKDQIPVVAITSNITEGFNQNEVVGKLRTHMNKYEENIPENIKYKFNNSTYFFNVLLF